MKFQEFLKMQDFLVVDLGDSVENSAPLFLQNYTADDTVANWEAVQTDFYPPSCVPESVREQQLPGELYGLHRIVSFDGLLPHAIRVGALSQKTV